MRRIRREPKIVSSKKDFYDLSFLDEKIPKVIHQIWIGQKSCPKKLMDTWKEKNPDFEYKFWNEETLKDITFECQDKINSMEELCGKADIMRYELLYKFGGIYIDADSFCVEPFDDYLISRREFFCWESEKHKKGLASNGNLGFVKNHPFLKLIIDHIKKSPVSRRETGKRAWETVGPKLLTLIYNRYKKRDEIEVLPSYTFLPQWKKNPYVYDKHGKVYAYQEWGSTFNSYGNMNSKLAPDILMPPEKYYSILITSYNTKNKYVKECLESIKNQEGHFGIELVWVNDGSSEEISKELENILNNFVKSCRFMKLKYKKLEVNKGHSPALNEGLKICSSEVIIKMDSDDTMTSDRIIKQLNYMKKNKDCVWVGGSIMYNGKKLEHPTMTLEKYKRKKTHWICNHPTVCFRKKEILDLGGYDENYINFAEDFDLELKILKKYKRLDNMSDVLVDYRTHPDQNTKKNIPPNLKKILDEIIQKNIFN